MATRISIHDFILANPIYVGATVTAWLVDVNGNVTANKATLYEAPVGSTEVANPQTLDSDGKFKQPVYCEDSVRLQVTGLHVASHFTGVISPGGTWRGDWAGAALYRAGDWVRDGAAGFNTKSVYQIVNTHTSGTWAADVVDATKLALVINYPDLLAQVVTDATEKAKGKVRLATMQDVLAGRGGAALQPRDFLALWAVSNPIGKWQKFIPASQWKGDLTATPAAASWQPGGAYKPAFDGLDFADGTANAAQHSRILPKGIDLTAGFTWRVVWGAPAGTAAQVVRWNVSAQALSDGDAMSTFFGAGGTTVDDAFLAVDTVQITPESPLATIAGTPLDGDLTAFQVARQGTDGADTFVNPARFLGAVLTFTRKAATDA